MGTQRGFTLLEMVIAITVLSIIMIGIGNYIAIGAKGYTHTVDRERLQSQARFLVARMTRELRHAAPNSLSHTAECLSFYPIIAPAVYYDTLPNESTQIMITPFAYSSQWQNTDYRVAVGFALAEQYQKNQRRVVSLLPMTAEHRSPYTLTVTDPFKTASPGKRLYLYRDKISYCQQGSTIVRKVNDNNGIRMADNVAAFTVNTERAGLNNSAIASFSIQYHDQRTDETADYKHSVQVMNVL